jgi:valyl-tRNA synthetase
LNNHKPSKAAIHWFDNTSLVEQLEIINDHYNKYRMSDALMSTYKLVWDDFCAWYLEAIKPDFVDGKSLPIDTSDLRCNYWFLRIFIKTDASMDAIYY